MAKEILLYGDVNTYSAAKLIESLNSIEKNENISIRMNTNGGDPEALNGMIAKAQEFGDRIFVKVDGKAYSAGALFLLYIPKENISANSESNFLLHRVAYPEWVETNTQIFTAELKASLEVANQKAKNALEARVSPERFKEITGTSIDDMFSMDSRLDVRFNAEQAKQLGLVGTIYNISPERKREMSAMYAEASNHNGVMFSSFEEVKTNPKINKTMTKDELKTSHPSLYNEIASLGASQERDRVGAWLAFAHVDSKRVHEGIKSGNALTQTDMAELTLAAASVKAVTEMSTSSAAPVVTEEPAQEPKASREQELEAFSKSLKHNAKS